ncbi:MAG: hypothetical protein ACREX4_07790, partial [Gammaproteobacteria bacterium]
ASWIGKGRAGEDLSIHVDESPLGQVAPMGVGLPLFSQGAGHERSHHLLARFQQPYRHARHYLGPTEDLGRRLEEHRAGRGARLMEVIKAQGIGFVLARTWRGSRTLERLIKHRKGTPRLCPICRGRLQGSRIETLMRCYRVGIRELAKRLVVPMRRVRQVRGEGVQGEAYVRDWIQGVTGLDPGAVEREETEKELV